MPSTLIPNKSGIESVLDDMIKQHYIDPIDRDIFRIEFIEEIVHEQENNEE